MLRHDFQPGKLVAGLFLSLTALVYAGDAGGAWDVSWFVAVPMVTGGLCLAGATAVLTRAIRGRRPSPARGAEEARCGRAPGAGPSHWTK
ncbi:hypothetical protein [Streptomyces sp. CRN 30]|uniref:hypothetical protein n=1 Tax=Streptomyces sp. CRN 30 TaxID=3075613 RepID=UPI002A82C7A9|nr:hypothetical protein [Streptomyces sp. CRN 30]